MRPPGTARRQELRIRQNSHPRTPPRLQMRPIAPAKPSDLFAAIVVFVTYKDRVSEGVRRVRRQEYVLRGVAPRW